MLAGLANGSVGEEGGRGRGVVGCGDRLRSKPASDIVYMSILRAQIISGVTYPHNAYEADLWVSQYIVQDGPPWREILYRCSCHNVYILSQSFLFDLILLLDSTIRMVPTILGCRCKHFHTLWSWITAWSGCTNISILIHKLEIVP